MKLSFKTYNQYNWIVIVVILLLAFRLFLNGIVPLMDKTEARYAEIARLMVETNNWTVLQIDYGIPFWAKPPLSTWLSAISFKLFGINEFSARLPYFLLSVLIALMTGKYAKRQNLSFWLPALVLFTIPQFFLHAGVVSTDTALTFSITLIMLSFWETMSGNRYWYWKYLFFIGIALGLLAKGPLVLILTIPPLFLWTWINKYFKRAWVLFPWTTGVFIVILLALPWYYLTEKQSSGFIDYFIIGEHFKRFFDSNWSGDKYGFPKSQPIGMIWIFLLLFALPWIQFAVVKIIKNKKFVIKNKWTSFLILWLLWTPLFFTTSKSLIHPYIMPVMVPIALLIIFWWKEFKNKKSALIIALSLPVIALGGYSYLYITNQVAFYANSDKHFVQNTQDLATPLFHYRKKSYSGQFYSKGKIEAIQLDEIQEQLHNKIPFTLIIKHKDTSRIPYTLLKNLTPISTNNKKKCYGFLAKDNNSLIKMNNESN